MSGTDRLGSRLDNLHEPSPPRGMCRQDRKSTRLNSSHTVIYPLSLHDALPILENLVCNSVTVDADLSDFWAAQSPTKTFVQRGLPSFRWLVHNVRCRGRIVWVADWTIFTNHHPRGECAVKIGRAHV